MYLEVPDYLTAEECAKLASLTEHGEFSDGLTTARGLSHGAKKNKQLNPTPAQSMLIDSSIKAAFERNAEIQAFTQAAEVRAPMLSLYTPGMYYKPHFDAPFLNTNDGNLRTDLSMTVFLSDPGAYDGGALILQTDYGDIDCKPEAGTAIVYSTLVRHEVESVTRGARIAIVSWFQSRVRDPINRAALFDVTMAWREIAAAAPESDAADRLRKTMLNLMRLWSEG